MNGYMNTFLNHTLQIARRPSFFASQRHILSQKIFQYRSYCHFKLSRDPNVIESSDAFGETINCSRIQFNEDLIELIQQKFNEIEKEEPPCAYYHVNYFPKEKYDYKTQNLNLFDLKSLEVVDVLEKSGWNVLPFSYFYHHQDPVISIAIHKHEKEIEFRIIANAIIK